MAAMGTAKPCSVSKSWRLTPLNLMARPLNLTTPLSTLTSRTPHLLGDVLPRRLDENLVEVGGLGVPEDGGFHRKDRPAVFVRLHPAQQLPVGVGDRDGGRPPG